MGERIYKAVVRRISTEKLKEWKEGLYDMYVYGKLPLMSFIVVISKELTERAERES